MARRKKRSTTPASILPAWIWLTLGILIGLGIALVTRMNGQVTLDKSSNIVKHNLPANTDESSNRKFDFYTLLPELEIVIPQEETIPPKQTSNNKPNAVGTYKGGYLLQAGSFNQYNEADTLKARLALLGVEAHIQSVDVNKTKWHRVRIGPSNDRQALEQLRKRLQQNHIDTLLMQAKE